MGFGFAMVRVEREPILWQPTSNLNSVNVDLKINIFDHKGILILLNHAVAFDGYKIYDPKGFEDRYDYSFNNWAEAYLIFKIKSK